MHFVCLHVKLDQCVAFEGFVLYAGGEYALYPNILYYLYKLWPT